MLIGSWFVLEFLGRFFFYFVFVGELIFIFIIVVVNGYEICKNLGVVFYFKGFIFLVFFGENKSVVL